MTIFYRNIEQDNEPSHHALCKFVEGLLQGVWSLDSSYKRSALKFWASHPEIGQFKMNKTSALKSKSLNFKSKKTKWSKTKCFVSFMRFGPSLKIKYPTNLKAIKPPCVWDIHLVTT